MTTEVKKTGRPCLLEYRPAIIQTVADSIKRGCYAVTACEVAGISQASYISYMAKGEEDVEKGDNDSHYAKFFQAVKEAESACEQEVASMIKETALSKKDAYAGMMYLERRHPSRWAKRERQTIDINKREEIIITQIEVVKDYAQLPAGDIMEGEVKELS